MLQERHVAGVGVPAPAPRRGAAGAGGGAAAGRGAARRRGAAPPRRAAAPPRHRRARARRLHPPRLPLPPRPHVRRYPPTRVLTVLCSMCSLLNVDIRRQRVVVGGVGERQLHVVALRGRVLVRRALPRPGHAGGPRAGWGRGRGRAGAPCGARRGRLAPAAARAQRLHRAARAALASVLRYVHYYYLR